MANKINLQKGLILIFMSQWQMGESCLMMLKYHSFFSIMVKLLFVDNNMLIRLQIGLDTRCESVQKQLFVDLNCSKNKGSPIQPFFFFLSICSVFHCVCDSWCTSLQLLFGFHRAYPAAQCEIGFFAVYLLDFIYPFSKKLSFWAFIFNLRNKSDRNLANGQVTVTFIAVLLFVCENTTNA